MTNISAPNYSVLYSYNSDGTVSLSSGHGVDERYTYDEQNRVTKLTSNDVLGNAGYTYNYSYDANGNITSKSALKSNQDRPQQSESYTYDGLNRVKTVNAMDYSLTYTYDANSNIVSEYNSNPKKSYTTNYTYDNNNRLTQSKVADNSNILDFTYDDNGNMISKSQTVPKTSTDSTTAQTSQLGTVSNTLTDTAYYDYNAVNQLTGYQNLNGVKESFTYNASGLRLTKTYNGTTTRFYYDGDNVVDETKNGILSAVNFYNAQGQVGSRQNYVDHVPTQGYIYYDAHGDAKDVRDGDLNVIAEYQYNLYGKEEKATGNFDNPFRYTGQYYDSESGMYYLRARFYDQDLKRFISEDPAKDGGNWYAYCAGNPVNGCDPTGFLSYIFYTSGKGSDFSTQANWQKKYLESKGETVELVEINSISAFKNGWNSMSGDVNNVFIYSHGNENTLIFENGSSTNAMSITGKNSSGKSIGNINDLQCKNINKLYLFSCNGGNVAAYTGQGKNLASVLSTKVKGGYVTAYDGSVSFNNGPDYSARLATNQWSFKKINSKYKGNSTHKPRGRVRYENGEWNAYWVGESTVTAG